MCEVCHVLRKPTPEMIQGDVEVTPAMEAAGADRLAELADCAGPTYVAGEVYRAMAALLPRETSEPSRAERHTKL